MTTATRFRRTTTVAATGAALAALLAGCTSKGSNTSAQSGPSASSSAPSRGSNNGSGGSTSSGSSSSSSSSSSSGSPGSASTTGGSPSGAPGSGCANLAASQAVKDAVTAAYKKQNPVLVHIVTSPGTFYYGQCQGTKYVASYFDLTPGATLPEQVAHQDDGAAMQFFSTDASGTWHWLTSEGLPPAPGGCSAISQIPAPLAAAWGDCSAHPKF